MIWAHEAAYTLRAYSTLSLPAILDYNHSASCSVVFVYTPLHFNILSASCGRKEGCVQWDRSLRINSKTCCLTRIKHWMLRRPGNKAKQVDTSPCHYWLWLRVSITQKFHWRCAMHVQCFHGSADLFCLAVWGPCTTRCRWWPPEDPASSPPSYHCMAHSWHHSPGTQTEQSLITKRNDPVLSVNILPHDIKSKFLTQWCSCQ